MIPVLCTVHLKNSKTKTFHYMIMIILTKTHTTYKKMAYCSTNIQGVRKCASARGLGGSECSILFYVFYSSLGLASLASAVMLATSTSLMASGRRPTLAFVAASQDLAVKAITAACTAAASVASVAAVEEARASECLEPTPNAVHFEERHLKSTQGSVCSDLPQHSYLQPQLR